MKRFVIILMLILSFSFILAMEGFLEFDFSSGKNIFNDSEFEPIYVSDFVRLNPEVEAVSYSIRGVNYGYVNLFGGIGDDFAMIPGNEYEIVVKNNVTVVMR